MNYDAILDRLSAYRNMCHLRQTEIADELHITQGQYSKLETGMIKISYDNLCILRQKGCDINMLITGKPNQELLPCLQALTLVEEKRFINYMKLCRWVCEQWNDDSGTMREPIGERLLEELISFQGYLTPQWERLRRAHHGISQTRMAAEMGVNIKKYRLLEKEEVKPDAELLLNVYEVTQCPPEFFMDERAYYLSVINDACKGNPEREEQLKSVLALVDSFEK